MDGKIPHPQRPVLALLPPEAESTACKPRPSAKEFSLHAHTIIKSGTRLQGPAAARRRFLAPLRQRCPQSRARLADVQPVQVDESGAGGVVRQAVVALAVDAGARRGVSRLRRKRTRMQRRNSNGWSAHGTGFPTTHRTAKQAGRVSPAAHVRLHQPKLHA